MGQTITFKNIDGSTMFIESERTTKGVTIAKCRYFGGGPLDQLKQCYCAKVGDFWAHGKTAREAVEDARFKAMRSGDKSDIIAEIKKTKFVKTIHYRAITGACREGCRHFLGSIGLEEDADGMPLDDVLSKVKGQYGFSQFTETLNA